MAQAGVGDQGALLVNLSSAVSTVKGDGTFQQRQAFSTGNLPRGLAVTDFNADGKSDMVTANNSDNTVSVLLSNGNGTFQAGQAFVAGTAPTRVATADFNSDDKADVVTTDFSGNTLSVHWATATGRFRPSSRSAPTPTRMLLLWPILTATG